MPTRRYYPSPSPWPTPRCYPLPTMSTGELNAIRKQRCFICRPFYGRACRWAMFGEFKPKGPKGTTPFALAHAIAFAMAHAEVLPTITPVHAEVLPTFSLAHAKVLPITIALAHARVLPPSPLPKLKCYLPSPYMYMHIYIYVYIYIYISCTYTCTYI